MLKCELDDALLIGDNMEVLYLIDVIWRRAAFKREPCIHCYCRTPIASANKLFINAFSRFLRLLSLFLFFSFSLFDAFVTYAPFLFLFNLDIVVPATPFTKYLVAVMANTALKQAIVRFVRQKHLSLWI